MAPSSSAASMELADQAAPKDSRAGAHSISSSTSTSKERKPRPKASLLSFLASDQAYDILQLAKLFVLAYTPCVASFLFITAFLLSYFFVDWDAWAFCHVSPLNLLLIACAFMPSLLLFYVKIKSSPCYLVDFACFKSKDSLKLTTEHCAKITWACGMFTEENMIFQLKVLLRSGLGEDTYGSPNLLRENAIPNIIAGREEMDLMLFGAIDDLLFQTDLDPARIDFLIIHACLFYPTPSLSARIVNRYKLRADVKTYNLSGMGCAAGLLAVNLAKDLLSVHRDKYVVIAGTENLTLNWYYGNDKSMLVPNTLFRCGSSALLLSNQRKDRARAKFELVQSVRTTTAASEKSFNCIVHREDDKGFIGTALSVKLLDVASHALTLNMTKLVPFNMPFSELLKTCVNAVQRMLLKHDVKPYMPDFKKAFAHFCIHPGGKAVIQGIGKTLGLSEYDMEPSKMSLHRFGNTSSSGLWYAMSYLEAKQRFKRGEKVWQVALGSGFKCNSVVWMALRDVKPTRGRNPWLECIDRYPVDISTGNSVSVTSRFEELMDMVRAAKKGQEEEQHGSLEQ
ncbi:hypothetical protein L7F22_050628 [Adiantum nelumboides]|nr:hypothetical protein [Adiantum nelumboides]